MRLIHASLILIATLATVYAIFSFLAMFDSDCYCGCLVAVCALAGVFLVDYLEHDYGRRWP